VAPIVNDFGCAQPAAVQGRGQEMRPQYALSGLTQPDKFIFLAKYAKIKRKGILVEVKHDFEKYDFHIGGNQHIGSQRVGLFAG
jgi:hypothetical protein